ncbi:MAG: hypothetical protein ACWGQW_26355, partial [bacterium]
MPYVRLILTFLTLICPSLAFSAPAKEALPPDRGGFIESMGQPLSFMPYAGLSIGAFAPSGNDTDVSSTLTLGLFKNILS